MVEYWCRGGEEGGGASKTWRGRSLQRPQVLPQQEDGAEGDQHGRYRHIQTSLVGQRCLGNAAAVLVPCLFTAKGGPILARPLIPPDPMLALS